MFSKELLQDMYLISYMVIQDKAFVFSKPTLILELLSGHYSRIVSDVALWSSVKKVRVRFS